MPDFTNFNLPVWAIVLLMVLAWLSREGLGAWLKVRQAQMKEKNDDDAKSMAGYHALIGELKARVTHLEGVLETMEDRHLKATELLREEHIACLKAQASQSAKIATLEDEVKGLREWRHQVANQDHASKLRNLPTEKRTDTAAGS